MKTINKKQETERPLILTNTKKSMLQKIEKLYEYSHIDSLNKIKNKPLIDSDNDIVNIDTMTETVSDPQDDAFFYLDLDTMTKAYSDSGDEIRTFNKWY